METQVRTPQSVFMQPQRLIVPLFQRPYVWNEENQWAPLWADVTRMATRSLNGGPLANQPHFLGAVVLQQLQTTTGSMQERTVIDGQQRLTTLQLLLDALHFALLEVDATQPALRVEALVANPEAFRDRPEDQFKVWPTNRDRAAFNEVMSAQHPISYTGLTHRNTRLVQGHKFFAEQAREWLQEEGPEQLGRRAAALERAARELLQLVVIDLTADENAQEIFETLNARGAQLTAADLIKNFIFQRLLEQQGNVEEAYKEHWKEFETGFWEKEVSVGRIRYSRSSLFINHWLIAQTAEEVVSRELFARFKRYADDEGQGQMLALLARLHHAAGVYRSLVVETVEGKKAIDRLDLFIYRTSTLESEVFKPLLLVLLDPEQPAVPADQLVKALDAIESWLVRRMLIRETTKHYNKVSIELITELKRTPREAAGDAIVEFLRRQESASGYWPDDTALRQEVASLLAYTRLRRGRLRMVLEAVEDHRRGWRGGAEGMGGERVARGRLAIEHIMPRKWQMHWPLTPSITDIERDQLLHTMGNLTLLTARLNGKVSNGPWHNKRDALKEHDVLKLNADLLHTAGEHWTEEQVRARTSAIIESIIQIWPVPEGHRSGFRSQTNRVRPRVEVADLVAAGFLSPGASLYSRRKRFSGRVATVLPDGRLDVDGVAYETPTGAARAMIGKKASVNGWLWFVLAPDSKRTLSDLWHEYVDQTSSDADEADVPEEDEE